MAQNFKLEDETLRKDGFLQKKIAPQIENGAMLSGDILTSIRVKANYFFKLRGMGMRGSFSSTFTGSVQKADVL